MCSYTRQNITVQNDIHTYKGPMLHTGAHLIETERELGHLSAQSD